MYTMQAYRQYQTTQTNTADAGELIVMLYHGAIKFLGRALASLQEGDLQEAHNGLTRSQAIIAELMGSLDTSKGDIAFNLFRLYDYMHYRLVHANLHKDPQPVEEVLRLLKELLPAWQYAAREARATQADIRTLVAGSLSYIAV